MRYFLLLLLLSPVCHADIAVSDFIGREVRLEQPARRIVALAPHIVENLYSAGAGDALVGVVSYSDYPLSAKKIPKVGSYKAFSLETILALQPDLVVMWASGNGMTTLDDLAALKVPVYVSEPRGLVDIGRAIRDYGTLAGSETTAEREALRIDSAIRQLVAENNGRESISVLYQVWHEPLQTLNGKHLISAVIELCGGYNIFADAVSLAPKISIESVLQRNPDAIVASGMDIARPEWLDQWLSYPSLSAVQNQALFFVHPDHIQRPTARVLLGAEALCQQLNSVPRRRWIE